MVPPVLEAERVRLRPFRDGDRDGVFAVFSDPQVARYWSFPAWSEVAQAAEFLAPHLEPPTMLEPPSSFNWAIADRATDACVGTTTIFALRRDQQRAEIGYSLRASEWGRGLAREAVGRALAYGFDELGLRRFEADIDPRNTASIALVERLGFVREGVLRERWNINAEICDTVFYGLLARELRR